ncbi:HupE/UreJ family protein [Chitinophaga horti]|uniref:HupE/UreJ family protein n=1 Tax=Chitinophaga horti TaxID=2920382 RepID=A0ABY6J2N3_9BACT|nr:HupE/UreJ family protein [Chitinophaga horti]UYQ93900.1 HupE/UreJ family protein [Chitinophaga horti]
MSEFGMYFQLGWQHIADLEGYDHILFIAALCAVYLLRDWKKVLVLVTAFTVGHSVTLALSVLNFIKVSSALIEFLIPVTIVITALTNIFRKNKDVTPERVQLSYWLALFFGLVHGMGFSNYLKSLLGTEGSVVMPLFAFNVGLEFGQLLIVAAILLIAGLAVNFGKVKRRDWTLFLSSAIFGIALIMTIERFNLLIKG